MDGSGVGRAVTFGEALIDVYPDHRVVAGAALHVAAHLAALGRETSLITRLGDDSDGALIRSTLEDQGVETSLVETDPELPTGEVTITFEGKVHSFTIHGPVAWDAIAGPDELPAHDIFCYGTLAARDSRSRSALERLLVASRAPIRAFDVNLRPPDVFADVVRMGLSSATVVKVSEDELGDVAALLDFEAAPAAYFAGGHAIRWLCVTKGERGAELHSRTGEMFSIEGPQVEVVDTIGAGDAFIAGLVDGLARGRDEASALEAAGAAAASTLATSGGLPPAPERA